MKILDALQGLVSGKINEIKDVISLIKLETRLASYSIMPLCLNLCFLLVVLVAVWLSTLGIFAYFIQIFFDNYLSTLLATWALNMVLLIALMKYLKFNLRSMSFSKTREYFSKKEDIIDENLAERIADQHHEDGTEITPTTP